ncbi:pitrilysin family protein [Mangrovimonas sp. DI 80]|uniref:M16 family metallopeptidase n=1 Tax=Mangrovimonas sp. DI 80 TaxID=1779330 RepID=UPI000975E7A3|nr:M16 family metallopeptidase [Mangrovimonas sp. DI 80]OMP30156.1 peptidase M16 [Mangrovimonas sp. DI 80]
MNRLVLSLAFFIAFLTKGVSQSINYNDPLPIDSTIKKGVLPNGMTYYIKSTDVVKNAASYYIIQNVGSILENDDQKGLAHFLEHMAFNGTESFPGKGILNTLQKHGAIFGKDINAYTGFDETVYNLSNIPTKDRLVDTCLTVLRDWSNYLLLTDEEIDAERGVIKEEWRTRQNGNMRILNTTMPIKYNYSKYADRMPIGSMDVVENFEYKALRDFYHDWYRTDLQAIAIIGDVDVNEIEEKIKNIFSVIPAVDGAKPRFLVDIPENDSLMYILGMDPEVSTASISFGIRHKRSLEDNTVGDLKRSLLESMTTRMLSDRISEEGRKPEASFLRARVGYGSMSRTSNVFSVSVYPKPNQQKEAFKDVLTLVESAVKYGYLESEIERTKLKIETSYENRIAKKNDASHQSIEAAIQNNFLVNSELTDVEKEYEIVKVLLKDITAKELHETIKALYSKKNRFITVTGVDGQDNLTKEQAENIIDAVENDNNIKAYSEDVVAETLISDTDIVPGAIQTTRINKSTGSTTFELSNGVTVHYKFVDKQKDQVTLRAVSYGGESLVKNEDLPSANFVENLVQMSGLGDFSATDLKKVLVGKTANVKPSLKGISESLSGSSNTKDVETMLQMVYLYFEKPRFDEQAFEVIKNNVDNYLIRKSKDINAKMRDSITVALYGKNDPKKPIYDQEYANAISFDKIKAVYEERFADISDFEFFIVGDVKEDELKPLLEKYVASVHSKNNSKEEMYKDNDSEWLSEHIQKDVYLAMEDPKASVNIAYKKDMSYNVKNSLYARALGDILQLRVTETVRESEGGAYSPRADAYMTREPKSQVFVSFKFDCNPDMADNLVDIVNNELRKIANGTILDNDLSKTKNNFIKEEEQSRNRNSYDLGMVMKYFRYQENPEDLSKFVDMVNKISKKDIQKIAQNVLEGSKSYEIVFKPLN